MDTGIVECGCGMVHEPLLAISAACERAAACVTPITAEETVPLREAAGRLLAVSIEAAYAMPHFDQSAMDGYALFAAGVSDGRNNLAISQRILAGEAGAPLMPGTAARIFTGAPLPEGADAVVVQEQTAACDARVTFDGPVTPGAHVRRRGEDISVGEALLAPGIRLTPRHLALLAAQGYSEVSVKRRPVVAVISTGSELRQPGEVLGRGALYDSNRPMLMALATEAGFSVVDGGCLPDNANLLAERLSELAGQVNLIVSSAGASVGDEDNSLRAAEAAGFTCEALRIAMKPGKPAVVGRCGATAYLGLPGNPLSALISWNILGGAMAAALAGRARPLPQGLAIPAANRFGHKPGRTEFVPARLISREGEKVAELLGHGVSGHLKPLAAAEGLAEIAATSGPVGAGDIVRFHPFCLF